MFLQRDSPQGKTSNTNKIIKKITINCKICKYYPLSLFTDGNPCLLFSIGKNLIIVKVVKIVKTIKTIKTVQIIQNCPNCMKSITERYYQNSLVMPTYYKKKTLPKKLDMF